MAWIVSSIGLDALTDYAATLFDYYLAIYDGETLIEEVKLTPENVHNWNDVSFDIDDEVTVTKINLSYSIKPSGIRTILFTDSINQFFQYGGIFEVLEPKIMFLI